MPQDPHKFNNIHNSSNIKLKYTPAEVAFWTNAKCDLKRSLKCIPQLDRYYDVSPQWNKLSYNINYVSQQ